MIANGLRRRRVEEQLRHRASHDLLTGLPNRAAIDAELRSRARAGGTVAVMLLDLDGFKEINDRLGHRAGDEFVILADVATPAEAEELAQRLVAALAQPVRCGESLVHVGASVGIALGGPGAADEPGGTDAADASDRDDETDRGEVDPDRLLDDADAAMYLAKARGSGYHTFVRSSAGRTPTPRERVTAGG